MSVTGYMLVQRSRSNRFLLWALVVAAHGCGSPQGRAAPPDRPESAPPAVGEICDLGDRIVVADARPNGNAIVADHGSTTALTGSVIVISRSDGKRVTAAIDRGSALYDDCGGSDGSHAGCSDLGGSTIRSAALGSDELLLDPDGHRSALVHAGIASPCRDSPVRPFASCSTRRWFAVVDVAESGKAIIRIHRGGDGPIITEPVTPERGRYTARRARLVIDNGIGSIELDGEREECLALFGPKS